MFVVTADLCDVSISVLLQCTDSDYPFGILELFLIFSRQPRRKSNLSDYLLKASLISVLTCPIIIYGSLHSVLLSQIYVIIPR
jgi:hypothetical protein